MRLCRARNRRRPRETGAFGDAVPSLGGDTQGPVSSAAISDSGQRARFMAGPAQQVTSAAGEVLLAARQLNGLTVLTAPICSIALHPADVRAQRVIAGQVGAQPRGAGMTVCGIGLA